MLAERRRSIEPDEHTREKEPGIEPEPPLHSIDEGRCLHCELGKPDESIKRESLKLGPRMSPKRN